MSGKKNGVLDSEKIVTNIDDKKNPFAIFALMEGEFEGDLISKNNWGKIIAVNPNSDGNTSWQYEETASYQYDNKNRVTNRTVTEKYGDQEETSSYTIQYKN